MAGTEQGSKDEPGIMSVILRIQNDLGPGIKLHSHCRSGDTDIGNHELDYSQKYEWSFNNSWLGTTLFWCSMKWNNMQGSFDVYSFKRDFAKCVYCYWSIRQDGAYCYRLTPDITKFTWQLMYTWKK
ncbi:Plant self-incompatibility S1 [Corchorus capsularis]|uniref:S-protein homolog n=1 Tax=Corchorus capsularis TaxID=210143 RepID=A0A1R3IK40_COCAP|nr:Plant self-incompatibility S1 [Corchorus capsularis]